MGLTTGGLAVLILLGILLIGSVGRIGIVILLIVGATLPFANSLANGVSAVGSAVAPLLNAIGGSGGPVG